MDWWSQHFQSQGFKGLKVLFHVDELPHTLAETMTERKNSKGHSEFLFRESMLAEQALYITQKCFYAEPESALPLRRDRSLVFNVSLESELDHLC